ncbi:hypothetical protein SDC9_179872 [bioreactor metagenome]|uniref:Uncharacterized protein n=1 Tax=bioreactor metagenome TaxID=1076179 RepID=A0A645H7Z2_9ZZZZ
MEDDPLRAGCRAGFFLHVAPALAALGLPLSGGDERQRLALTVLREVHLRFVGDEHWRLLQRYPEISVVPLPVFVHGVISFDAEAVDLPLALAVHPAEPGAEVEARPFVGEVMRNDPDPLVDGLEVAARQQGRVFQLRPVEVRRAVGGVGEDVSPFREICLTAAAVVVHSAVVDGECLRCGEGDAAAEAARAAEPGEADGAAGGP